MATLRIYRTYNYVDKDPVIDKVRTVLKDEGLLKKLPLVHELSGVAVATMDNWFHGSTMRPQNPTIEAVLTSLGYERQIVKTSTLDYDKEREKARRWRERQEALADAGKARAKSQANGHARSRRTRT